MDAEERPSKLRKLDSPNDDAQAISTIPPPVFDEALSEVSKPAEDVANEFPASAVEHNDNDFDSQDQAVNGENLATEPMSKNQLKKLRRKQAWEDGRDYRKAKRKEKIQAKKVRRRAEREERAQTVQQNGSISQVPPARTPRPRRPLRLPVAIVIDCGFDNLMVEKERISLGSQLTRSYSDTHRAQYQPHLYVSSWSGLLKERFDTVLTGNYQNWKDVIFTEQDFVGAAEQARSAMRSKQGGGMVAAFEKYSKTSDIETNPRDKEKDQPGVLTEPASRPQTANAELTSTEPNPSMQLAESPTDNLNDVIYLTSESPFTLTSLEPYHTYVVGGLVDKNRHKGICYKTARDRGVRTAKLPIGEYMEMTSRFVLATNHVVEIMLKWLECGNWAEAFMKVMPKRKGGRLRNVANPLREGEQPATEEQGQDTDDSEEGVTPVSRSDGESKNLAGLDKENEGDEKEDAS